MHRFASGGRGADYNWGMKRRRIVVVALVALAVLVLPAYLRAYTLSGASDAPTLLYGDTAIVNQAAYWVKLPYSPVKLVHISHPKRWDLVQVMRPDRPGLVFKRVIGLPSETVEIRSNQVIIDDRPVEQKQLRSADFAWVSERHRMGSAVYNEAGHWAAFTPGGGLWPNMASVRLKSDEYFLIGDNRDVSLDCRVWGPLKEGSIYGKVVMTLATGPRKK